MKKNVKRVVAGLLAFVLVFTGIDFTGLRTYADDLDDSVIEISEDAVVSGTEVAADETEDGDDPEILEVLGSNDPDALAITMDINWGQGNEPNTLKDSPEFHNSFGMEVGR